MVLCGGICIITIITIFLCIKFIYKATKAKTFDECIFVSILLGIADILILIALLNEMNDKNIIAFFSELIPILGEKATIKYVRNILCICTNDTLEKLNIINLTTGQIQKKDIFVATPLTPSYCINRKYLAKLFIMTGTWPWQKNKIVWPED